MALLSNVKWGRVVRASVATHLANVVLTVVVVFVSTSLAVGLQGTPDQGSIDGRSAQIGTWGVPVLTLFAAAWVARTVEPRTAALHGALVGLLAALIFGLVFFWPFDLATLVLFALMLVAGWLGGLIGRRRALPR
jgi:hypothetical protein